jgi:hypothetical protein
MISEQLQQCRPTFRNDRKSASFVGTPIGDFSVTVNSSVDRPFLWNATDVEDSGNIIPRECNFFVSRDKKIWLTEYKEGTTEEEWSEVGVDDKTGEFKQWIKEKVEEVELEVKKLEESKV